MLGRMTLACPTARGLLAPVAPEAAAVSRFAVASFRWEGELCVAAGTGYTGEDGVECAVPVEVAPRFWNAVLGAGISPAGLGLFTFAETAEDAWRALHDSRLVAGRPLGPKPAL